MSEATIDCDEKLFEAFLDGDEHSFESLVRRYEHPLMGFLVRYTRSVHMAEDVFQDAFVKVYEKRHLFDTSRVFKPWLYRIAVNAALDRFRDKKPLPFEMEDGLEPEDPSDTPLDTLDKKEIGEKVAEAVERLPDHQKQVFILREYESFSYNEIADITGRPLNTVKSDMRRGLIKLRELLSHLADHYTQIKAS